MPAKGNLTPVSRDPTQDLCTVPVGLTTIPFLCHSVAGELGPPAAPESTPFSPRCKSTRRGRRGGRSPAEMVSEEPPGRTGVTVPVIGDVPPPWVRPPTPALVVVVRDARQNLQQALLRLRIRKAVGTPHDHRRVARHALGHPALGVLVEPRCDAMGEAELTLVVVGFRLWGPGAQSSNPFSSSRTS